MDIQMNFKEGAQVAIEEQIAIFANSKDSRKAFSVEVGKFCQVFTISRLQPNGMKLRINASFYINNDGGATSLEQISEGVCSGANSLLESEFAFLRAAIRTGITIIGDTIFEPHENEFRFLVGQQGLTVNFLSAQLDYYNKANVATLFV
jgi:hypothetical protein